MLNYVWIALVAIGVIAAASSDIYDASTNRYRNGEWFEVRYDSISAEAGTVSFTKEYFDHFYDVNMGGSDTLVFPATLSSDSVRITLGAETPEIWTTIAKTAGSEKRLDAVIRRHTDGYLFVVFPITSLVRTKAVLDAVISYSSLAVTISLALIGVMAFWLGIMKLGEDSGLINIIARVMKPVMARIFPEIPPDHPAIGAMIMNIAANMLGLNNAATPLGLKAMEELEKLNPNKGTASNAMVTFLVINTGGLTIIPATAIAIRAALGSKDPTVILMTSFFGAGLATIAGIAAAKILQRLKPYRIEKVAKAAEAENK